MVFGDGALARAVAGHRAARNPTVLVTGGDPVPGPWLWRRADVASGEGVRSALRDATHVVCAADGAAHGLHVVARPDANLAVTLVVPCGLAPPVEPHWNLLEVGVVWGPGDPLFDVWTSAAARGRLFVAEVGRMPILAADRAVAAAEALGLLRGQRWRLPGTARTMVDLATSGWPSARQFRVPVALARAFLGLPPALLRRRAALPMPTPWTPGWGSG